MLQWESINLRKSIYLSIYLSIKVVDPRHKRKDDYNKSGKEDYTRETK